jgi:hypothetical protein
MWVVLYTALILVQILNPGRVKDLMSIAFLPALTFTLATQLAGSLISLKRIG